MERIIFATETGSKYEIDYTTGRVRRITGKNPATRRFGGNSDGEWRSYIEITDVVVGRPVIVSWERDARPDDERMKHHTMTSRVVAIEEV